VAPSLKNLINRILNEGMTRSKNAGFFIEKAKYLTSGIFYITQRLVKSLTKI
jgi:hypothetical protein